MSAVDLSVVIPTFRGGDSIIELLDRLDATLTPRGVRYEAVVVNDASPDDTWAVLQKEQPSRPHLVVIDLLRNHGQALATMCGLAHTRGALVATMDDDLQHPPEELATLLDALDSNPDWDAAIGWWPRGDQGFARDLGSWLHATMDRLAYGTPKGFRHTTFRLLRRAVVDAIIDHETRTPVMSPLIHQSASNVHNVEVEHHARPYGSSTFTVREGVSRVVTNFFQGTTLPLRLLSRFGLLTSVLAAIVGGFFLARWILGYQTPRGWASSFVATMFFGGAVLFALGLLGEYVSIIMREVRRPPRWSVRRTLPPDRVVRE